jgi:hypothetical protein
MPKNVQVIAQIRDKEGNNIINNLTTQLVGSSGYSGNKLPLSNMFGGNLVYTISSNIPDTTYTLEVIPDNSGMKTEFQYKTKTTIPIGINSKKLDFGTIKLENLNPPPVDEPKNTPTYQVAADKSEVKGTITFEEDSEFGYLGQIVLTNFPEGYVKTSTITTSPIAEANYETLKVEALKLGQVVLDELKTDTVDFGILEIKGDGVITPYKIKGRIVDDNNDPIIGANIKTTDGISDTSAEGGYFTLRGDYTSGSFFDINISAKNYNQITSTPFTLNYTIIENIGTLKLTSLNQISTEEEQQIQGFNQQQNELFNFDTKKDFVSIQQEKIIDQIKTKLSPFIIKLITEFGLSQLPKLLEKAKTEGTEAVKIEIKKQTPSCPADIKGLNEIIEKKNKLTKQLNNINNGVTSIQNFITPISTTIDISDKAIPPLKIAIKSLAFIPSTVTTPIPSGAYAELKDGLKILEDLINLSSTKVKNMDFQLNFLKLEIEKIITLLSILDALIQGCAEELGGTAEQQTQISNELLNSTQQQSQQLSPVVTNVNGFEMEVITVDNITVDGLKRRRAVARNKSGVIMLQGEPSFSSNDQILIDELVFYIQQNDLKA